MEGINVPYFQWLRVRPGSLLDSARSVGTIPKHAHNQRLNGILESFPDRFRGGGDLPTSAEFGSHPGSLGCRRARKLLQVPDEMTLLGQLCGASRTRAKSFSGVRSRLAPCDAS